MENNFSYKIKPLSTTEKARWKKISRHAIEYVRLSSPGYMISSFWLEYAEEIRTMPLRTSDVFVVSFPRSGTTWTQELVWLIINDMDFEQAKSVPLTTRYAFLEIFMNFQSLGKHFLKEFENNDEKRKMVEELMTPVHKKLSGTTSQRFIKSHMPLALLPCGTLNTAKVVYIARDPRDVAVSCYHFSQSNRWHNINCEFKEFFELFMDDLVPRTPFFEHVKEAWAQRYHHNMLFLFYEELSKDLKSCARRVANFFGKQYSDEQMDILCQHLEFSKFQRNNAVNLQALKEIGIMSPEKDNFIRKGKVGGWREYFDKELTLRAERWITDNLQDTDLKFPQQNH